MIFDFRIKTDQTLINLNIFMNDLSITGPNLLIKYKENLVFHDF